MSTRRAGQHARETTRRLALRALVVLAVIVTSGVLAGLAVGFTSWTFVGVELGVIAGLWLLDKRTTPRIQRWDNGATGEEQVGRIIDGLLEHGWHAIHDVSLGRGNIDHVLIGPAGLLTVETKSHGGRIDVRRLDVGWLDQAYAEAKLLAAVSGREVAPLLVFSQAYLYPKPISRQKGVVVLPARMLPGHLARRKRELGSEEARDVHARLRVALEQDRKS